MEIDIVGADGYFYKHLMIGTNPWSSLDGFGG